MTFKDVNTAKGERAFQAREWEKVWRLKWCSVASAWALWERK